MYTNPNWNNILTPPFNWVKSVEKIIKSESIPSFGNLIYLVSDYGGQHKDSKYETYSLLYIDMTQISDWELARRDLRKKHLPDKRRISYKGLGDKYKQNFLIPFLEESSLLSGVLTTIVVNKSIGALCADKQNFDSVQRTYGLNSAWSYIGFERMARIINFVCLLSAGLAKPGQEIAWVTDEDEILANSNKAKDVQLLIGKFAGMYGNNLLNCKLSLGSATIDPGDNLEEDLIALTDLSAGCLSEIINKVSIASGGKIYPTIAVPHNKPFNNKTEIILDWYFHKSPSLSKTIVLFEVHKTGYSVSKYEMKV